MECLSRRLQRAAPPPPPWASAPLPRCLHMFRGEDGIQWCMDMNKYVHNAFWPKQVLEVLPSPPSSSAHGQGVAWARGP